MSWSKVRLAAGSVMVAAGVILAGFVGWENFGTGIETGRVQRELQNELGGTIPEELWGAKPGGMTVPSSPVTSDNPSGGPPATTFPHGKVPYGDSLVTTREAGGPVGIIAIPTIGVSKVVVAGTGVSELKKGPGMYNSSAFPGEHRNVAIAGHRTTYGAPFGELDELRIGDPVIVSRRTTKGSQVWYRYEVTESVIVTPGDVSVLEDDPDGAGTLTLTTCHPKFSDRERLIIKAKLVDA